jgi:multidrug efflux pump subunit AcrA (membrane-fusion protein)
MRRLFFLPLLAPLLVTIAGCRGGAAANANADDGASAAAPAMGKAAVTAGLTLDAEARRRAGIETHRLAATSTAGVVALTGTLIADPGRVTTIEAPIAGRLATVDGGRWPGFGERVAAATILGQVSDAKPLLANRGGVVTRVGAQPGQIVQAGQVLLEVTDFSAPLARIVWRSDAAAPAEVRVSPLGSSTSVIARLVGSAPDADSLTRLPVYLYRASHAWPGAGPGTVVQVTTTASGPRGHGLFVPADAVVQWEGLTWAYVEQFADGRYAYARVRVDTNDPVPGGWLVQGGDQLTPGDAVVVRGAQQLLSEEFKSRATTGDDDEQ